MRYLTPFDLSKIKTIEVDTAVIGGGLAGIYTSINLSKLGVNHLLISKNDLNISNSYLAQGGIAAAISPEDTPEKHFQDTLKAGKGLCIEENVQILTDEGIRRVLDLLEIGVPFEKDSKGIPILTQEGVHSVKRILYSGDKTGEALINYLKNFLNKEKLLIGYSLEEIITDEDKVVGIIISQNGENIFVKLKSLVLATGGYSSIFERNSSAYQISGDTLGVALRAGLKLKDLEFIQFHPTALYLENQPAKLISEAVRGEGAILVDEKGERFIDELRPRDEVARAIFQKYLQNQRVFLDIQPIYEKGIDFEKRFPSITKLLKEYNLKNLIPVSPAAHYTIGGIDTDAFGRTNIKGIYAVGEVSCTGVHGANRLASNSLLECVVFPYRTAYEIYKYNLYNKIENINLKNNINRKEKVENKDIIQKLKEIMWKQAGLIRTEEGLKEGINSIEKLKTEAINNSRKIYDLLLLAEAVLKSALARKESRGSHYRKDYPSTDTRYNKHTEVILDKNDIKINLEVN